MEVGDIVEFKIKGYPYSRTGVILAKAKYNKFKVKVVYEKYRKIYTKSHKELTLKKGVL